MTDDVLLAIVLECIAAKRIPLRTEQDLAALYHWLQVITSQLPPERLTSPP
jgi:hypothetical protein